MSFVTVFITKELMNPSMFFMIALFLKASAGPLHLWFISVATMCEWMSFLLINSWQKLIPLFLLESYCMEVSSILIFICTASAFLGTMTNFSSSSLKNILILSGISNLSWMLLGLSSQTSLWKIFFIIYFINLYFITQLSFSKLSEKSTIIFLTFLSISGMPPLLGFYPKMLIILSSLWMSLFWLISLFLFFSVLDLYLYSRLSMYALIKSQKNSSWLKKKSALKNLMFVLINVWGGMLVFF